MKVLDSSAMIAYLKGEPGHTVVLRMVEDGEELFAHAINLAEVFYDFLGVASDVFAEQSIVTLKTDGITERNDMDGAFWRDVAFLIAARRVQPPGLARPREKPRLALGDACGLALARRLGVAFVSADRAELEPIHHSGLATVLFIR